jgi:hypothetical protein
MHWAWAGHLSRTGSGPVDCDLMPLFVDHDGAFQQVYAAAPGMVWLVRPDGHIA